MDGGDGKKKGRITIYTAKQNYIPASCRHFSRPPYPSHAARPPFFRPLFLLYLIMETAQNIKTIVRKFIIDNIFDGVDDGQVKDDTSLIKTRTMDSIVALKLVSYLEEKFGIEFEAHEVDQDNLDTIDTIVAFVQKKMK